MRRPVIYMDAFRNHQRHLSPGQQIVSRLYFGLGYRAIPSIRRLAAKLRVPRREVARLLDSAVFVLTRGYEHGR